MQNRLKIIACGYVNREDDYTLTDTQITVIDCKTKKIYPVYVELWDYDYYKIEVWDQSCAEVIDECVIDSSGGIFADDDFACDKLDAEFADEVQRLVIDYFIKEF